MSSKEPLSADQMKDQMKNAYYHLTDIYDACHEIERNVPKPNPQ